MHQLITGSDTSIPAVCYACRLWCPLPCHKWVWLNWYLSTLGSRWKASITAVSCCLSRCFQQSNMSQNVVYSQNNRLFTVKLVIFLCSVISQGKVVALDRWGGKWNQLSMTHRLTTNYAKNYRNQTLIAKVIVENVVTCFFRTRCRQKDFIWQVQYKQVQHLTQTDTMAGCQAASVDNTGRPLLKKLQHWPFRFML